MFHKKQKKIDVVFWVFGVIALGIILSMAFLLVSLFSKVDIKDDLIEKVVLPSFTPEELIAQYDESVDTLFVDAVQDSDTPMDDLLNSIEERLIDMRVPREMQVEHLQAVLSIAQLRARLAQSDEENIRLSVRSIFDSLLQD
jgi:hypothetical protein